MFRAFDSRSRNVDAMVEMFVATVWMTLVGSEEGSRFARLAEDSFRREMKRSAKDLVEDGPD